MTTPDYGETFISLADAEALAIGTRQWRGTSIEFSDDGEHWSEAWVPKPDGAPHPLLARGTTKRFMVTNGQFGGVIASDIVSTSRTVRWDEYFPAADPAASDRWNRMPTILLGKVAAVSSIRSAFRDVIGDRHERAEMDQAAADTLPGADRDWDAEILATETVDAVTKLHGEMRQARMVTPAREVALRSRRKALSAPQPETPKPAPKPAVTKPKTPTAVEQAYREAEQKATPRRARG